MPGWVSPVSGQALEYDADFKGPVGKRSTTDIVWLILFIIFVTGWIFLVFFAIVRSDPSRLIRPTDSSGNVCGRDEIVKDKPYLLFFDITRCASPKVPFTGCPTPQICVKKCPDKNWFSNDNTLIRTDDLYCTYDVNITERTDMRGLIGENKCASYYLSSSNLANRCIPRNLSLFTNELLDNRLWEGTHLHNHNRYEYIVDGIEYLSRFVKIQEIVEGAVFDIQNLWYVILIFCVIAMALSLLWIVLMRCFATLMIIISFISFGALFIYGAYFSLKKYLELSNEVVSEDQTLEGRFAGFINESPEVSKNLWLTLFIIIVVLFFICFILVIFLRNRIRIAIELIAEASKAVGHSAMTLFFPTVPYILQIGVIAVFGATIALLASVSHKEYRVFCHGDCNCPEIQENSTCQPDAFEQLSCVGSTVSCQFFKHQSHNYIIGLQVYNVFVFFWIMCFITAFGEMVLAGTFSTWYWNSNKEEKPDNLLSGSIYRSFRFHLGTVACGALIIAIIKTIRAIFEYIDYQLKQYADSRIAKCFMCCCRCCLWCLENFLRFVNRNAYIYCAIYGTNFCTSAKKSFNLLMRNIVRVVVLDKVADLLLFIGKLTITAAMMLFSFCIFSQEFFDFRDVLPPYRFYWTPVLIITMASFFIATSFFSVYSMAVDTLFLCFLEDCERNDGSSDRPYRMSKKLMKILSKKNEAIEANGKEE